MKQIAGLLLLLIAIMVGLGCNIGPFVDGASQLLVGLFLTGSLLTLFHAIVIGFRVFLSGTASQPLPPAPERLLRRIRPIWWLAVVAVATVGDAAGSELTAVSEDAQLAMRAGVPEFTTTAAGELDPAQLAVMERCFGVEVGSIERFRWATSLAAPGHPDHGVVTYTVWCVVGDVSQRLSVRGAPTMVSGTGEKMASEPPRLVPRVPRPPRLRLAKQVPALPFGIHVRPVVAVPLGDLGDAADTGYGIEVDLDYELSPNLALTAGFGYLRWELGMPETEASFMELLGIEVDAHWRAVPITAGVRLQTGNRDVSAYIALNAGLHRVTVDSETTPISGTSGDRYSVTITREKPGVGAGVGAQGRIGSAVLGVAARYTWVRSWTARDLDPDASADGEGPSIGWLTAGVTLGYRVGW